MNNSEFLASVVNTVQQFSNIFPELVLNIKDTSSKIIYSSAAHTRLLSKSELQIIGKTTLPTKNKLYNPRNSILEDQKVITQKKMYIFLKINRYHGKLIPLIMKKIPIINPMNNESVGIFCQFDSVHITNLSHEINKLFHKKTNLFTHIKNIRLTRRQKQIIFFFMSNFSSQEIAETLSKISGKTISKSAIDNVFTNQLFTKFNVYSRTALHDILIKYGYDNLIPHEVLMDLSIPLNVQLY